MRCHALYPVMRLKHVHIFVSFTLIDLVLQLLAEAIVLVLKHGEDRTCSSAPNQLLSPCSRVLKVLVAALSKLIPPEELVLSQFLREQG